MHVADPTAAVTGMAYCSGSGHINAWRAAPNPAMRVVGFAALICPEAQAHISWNNPFYTNAPRTRDVLLQVFRDVCLPRRKSGIDVQIRRRAWRCGTGGGSRPSRPRRECRRPARQIIPDDSFRYETRAAVFGCRQGPRGIPRFLAAGRAQRHYMLSTTTPQGRDMRERSHEA